MTSLPLFMVAALVITLALFIWRANPSVTANRWFSAFTMAVGSWTVGVGGLHSGAYLDLWASITFASASLIPATFLNFAHSYPQRSRWPPLRLVQLALLIGVAFALLSLGTPLIVSHPRLTEAGLTRKAGALYPTFAVYFILTWCLALGMCVQKWFHARGQQRTQLQYAIGAVLLSGAGAISSNLLAPLITGRSIHTWIGPYFTLILVALVAHAIIRHRLMDLRLVIHRGLTLAIAIVVSLVPVAVVLGFAWPRLTLYLEPSEMLVVLVAVVLMGLLVPVIRDCAGRFLDRYVYRAQANFRQTVRTASGTLTRVLDLDTLLRFLTDTVLRSTRAEGAAVYFVEHGVLQCGAHDRHPSAPGFGAPETCPDAVLVALASSRDLILTDELLHDAVKSERRALHEMLTGLDWALVLPLMSEKVVVGAIALGPKLSGDPFYPEDLDLLMTLANQAGVAVTNARLYAQVVLANERLGNIVATIESGVVAADADGRIALFNRAATQLTGIATAGALERSIDDLPPCLADALHRSMAERRPLTLPDVELSDGALTRPIICTAAPLLEPSGAVLGAVAVFSDLTPLRELELGRRRAERLAYFEMLASGLAHEIQNPLVSIKTFAHLLPQRHGDGRFVAEFSRIVGHEIGRMERLIERLRTLARPSDRPRRPVDLRAPITRAMESMRAAFEEKSIVVSSALGATPCVVVGDEEELEQLFQNLLMNAHEATPPRGMLRVELAASGGRAVAAVADTGPGVPPDVLQRVFEPFFTTKQRGSGLGLAICTAIAQAHDARLQVANRPTGGAVFSVDFPISVDARVRA